jgi:hypothetical protein
MPIALLVALAASLGIHVAALFGPEIDLSTEPEIVPLMAELKPMPLPKAPPEAADRPEKPVAAKPSKPRRKVEKVASASSVLSVPESSAEAAAEASAEATAEEAAEEVASATAVASPDPAEPPPALEPRLPPRGMIRYRVDRGDSNFEIGVSRHEWEIADGRYRLTSLVETSGLVWLFKAYRIEMESRGWLTAEGLRPESFAIRRNGQETREKAAFDWENMTVRVGDRAEQALSFGAQDLLSFNFQLGYLAHPEAGSTLHIATGRKYGVYRIEVLGDEEIEVPAGVMRTLHLRAPGVNTTELWLAYDYLLLPVKIRHVDSKGDSLVQVATHIQVNPP